MLLLELVLGQDLIVSVAMTPYTTAITAAIEVIVFADSVTLIAAVQVEAF